MKALMWFAILAGSALVALAAVVAPAPLVLLPGLLLVLGAAAYARRHPERGLAGCFFLVLLAGTKYRVRDPLAVVSGSIDAQILLELSLYAAVIVVAMGLVIGRRLEGAPGWPELALGVYVLFALVSAAWSPVPALTAVRSLQLAALLLLAVAGARTVDRRALVRAAAWGCAAYVLAFASLALLGPAAAPGASLTAGDRFSWLQVHPGAAGTYAATGALLLSSFLAFAPSSWPVRRVALAAMVVVLVLVLLATRSRGPVIAFIAAAGALGLLRWGRGWVAAGAVSILVVALLALVSLGTSVDDTIRAAAASDAPGLVYLFRGQTAEQFGQFTGRIELWSYAMDIALERPLFGHGYLSSRVVLQDFAWAGYAHSGLIQSLLDFGIVGTLPLWGTAVAVIGRVLAERTRGWPRGAVPDAAAFGAVCFLLINSVISESFAGPPGWDVLLLFAAALVVGPGHVREPEPVA